MKVYGSFAELGVVVGKTRSGNLRCLTSYGCHRLEWAADGKIMVRGEPVHVLVRTLAPGRVLVHRPELGTSHAE